MSFDNLGVPYYTYFQANNSLYSNMTTYIYTDGNEIIDQSKLALQNYQPTSSTQEIFMISPSSIAPSADHMQSNIGYDYANFTDFGKQICLSFY